MPKKAHLTRKQKNEIKKMMKQRENNEHKSPKTPSPKPHSPKPHSYKYVSRGYNKQFRNYLNNKMFKYVFSGLKLSRKRK